MQQLSGLDASFLYLETPSQHMHIAGLAIYDPKTAPGGEVGFKQIIAHIVDRTKNISAISDRLLTVPFRLDHPYWINDGEFDPEFHIRHIALPKPGDWRQLCILVSRLHARPLDRSRPLWETYVIEGLDNVEGYPEGCFAVFNKVHHAAIDGASGTELTAATHDLSPKGEVREPKASLAVDRKPSAWQLVVKSQLNNIRQPFRLVDVAVKTVPSLAKAATGVASGRLQRVTKIPRTRFNGKVSPHRVFDAVKFEFEDIRAIKNSVEGVTVNDVAIAIVGGALRKYLEAKNELPETSLAAMAPINVRTEDKKGTGGNQVSQMTVSVCSDVEDAFERLLAVNQGTKNAKELTNAVGAKAMMDYSQFVPSTITATAARLSSSMGLANRMTPQYNCVITNVPGLQIPLYFAGAQMLTTFGTGPVLDGNGLFHAISSYCGQLGIAFTSCREMIPDPAFYAECIQASFDELKGAAETVVATASKPADKTA